MIALLAALQFVNPDDRAFITDFSDVRAIAVTPSVVYVATPHALVVYDRGSLRWRRTVGPMDGYDGGRGVTSMVADPSDDTAWLAASGAWMTYRPFARDLQHGPLPGVVRQVVLDDRDPSRGAWFETAAGWYFVPRGGGVALPASDVPPPSRRIAPLDAATVRRRAPGIETAIFRVIRDDLFREFPVTAAAQSGVDRALFLGTGGNGAFRVEAVGYGTERLPAGLLGDGAASVVITGGHVCAGSGPAMDAGGRAPRHRGVTCFDEALGTFTPYEPRPAEAPLGTSVRDVAAGARGTVWAASETGVVRAGSGRAVRLTSADGLPSDDARALAAVQGGVWVGTGLGIGFVSDDARPAVTAASRFGAAVGALLVASDTLWIGSAVGLLVLAPAAPQPALVQGGPAALGSAIVAIARLGDTLVVATATQLLARIGGAWRDIGAAPPRIGRINALAADGQALWAAGDAGIAYLMPGWAAWQPFGAGPEMPGPVLDIAASRRYVWTASPAGVMRYDRRALVR